MTKAKFETTLLRASLAVLAGLLVGIIAAQMLVWGALPALGAAEWFDLLLAHLATKWLDYGPGFVLGLLVWLGFHHAGWRHVGLALLVGALSFYVASRAAALIFLLFSPYWVFDLAFFVPRWSEIALGAFMALLMWVIAYWQPPRGQYVSKVLGD